MFSFMWLKSLCSVIAAVLVDGVRERGQAQAVRWPSPWGHGSMANPRVAFRVCAAKCCSGCQHPRPKDRADFGLGIRLFQACFGIIWSLHSLSLECTPSYAIANLG